jgi:hypothetical protein
MRFAVTHRWSALGRYVTFNVIAMLTASALMQDVARMAASLSPMTAPGAVAGPSRVEAFKFGEIAAATAPQVPVPRLIVARRSPEMSIRTLAVQLDEAEGVKVKPVKANRKIVRTAKAGRNRKVIAHRPGKLPDSVIFAAAFEAVVSVPVRSKRMPPIAESSRDVTNRSLGVIMALKN